MLKLRSRSIYKALLIPFPFLYAPAAKAFPDLIRKGYNSCVTCHVSPSGGGALNAYARGMSSELFMFGYEGSGELFGMPALAEWQDPTGLFTALKADFQADWRSVTFRAERAGVAITETVPMEFVGRIAVHAGKTTDLVLDYGQYGKDGSLESRTHYIQVRTSKYLSFRAGRFLPAFGINLDDHTAFVRSALGFKQGLESFALEAHFEDENVVSSLTRIVGHDVVIQESNKRWSFESETREGIAARSGMKFGPRYAVGMSGYFDSKRRVFGGWAALAPIKDLLYFLAEFDDQRTLDGEYMDHRQYGFLRIGSEVVRGLTLQVDTNIEKTDEASRVRVGAGVQVLPLPHLELRLEGRTEEETKTILGVIHVWL